MRGGDRARGGQRLMKRLDQGIGSFLLEAIPARRSSAERPNAQAHQALAGGDCRVASGPRMTNEAMTTSISATMLPAAKIVEYCSPIRSRNGPVPNAAMP